MEFIDGIDLAALIRLARGAEISIPLPLVLRIGSDLCAGLHAAHTATGDQGEPLGIVHRDISPHNILIARSGIAKVADFGVSKAADQLRRTRTGELKGKIVYMAPEQVDSTLGDADARTDIFAVGLTLYEMLTFQRPLKRDSEVVSLTAVIRADIKDLRELRPDLPEDFTATVMRCLRRLPAERFPDAAELHRALEKVAVGHGWVSSPTAFADFVAQLPAGTAEGKAAGKAAGKPPDDDTDTRARTTPVSSSSRKDP
jgi:serine/threonine protein kinase